MAKAEGFLAHINSQTPDQTLDRLFAAEQFKLDDLFATYAPINPSKSHLHQMDIVHSRLKKYSDSLKSQIVEVVVENQAEGFLQIPEKLVEFQSQFSLLKHSVDRYHCQVGSASKMISSGYNQVQAQAVEIDRLQEERAALIRKISL
jgi:hypothetical protein